VETLDELGLLVDVDPERDPAPVRPLPEGGAEALAARVEELRTEPKQQHFVTDAAKDGRGDRHQARPRGLGRLLNRD
jgi:hypothetical protein